MRAASPESRLSHEVRNYAIARPALLATPPSYLATPQLVLVHPRSHLRRRVACGSGLHRLHTWLHARELQFCVRVSRATRVGSDS